MPHETRVKKEIRPIIISTIDSELGNEEWKTPNHPIVTAPSSASDTGTAGEVRFVTGFVYFCIATDTWERAVIATW